MNLDPKDRHKTAFCTDFGLFEWNRLPQGLKNAATSFQRLLEIILAGLKEFNINTYIDDLIIASKTFDEHLEKLDMVFSRLSDHNLKINPAKCQLAQGQINYLGFHIKDGKIYPEDKNIQSITNFPVPKTKKHIRQFLGLCNYYRKFLNNFAEIALPLTNLTKNKNNFNWDNCCQKSFENLKSQLINSPCLTIPDVNKDFILHTDASGYAIGAVLSQRDEAGDLHPVGFASRTLKDAETRYSVFERELLAIIWGVGHFRHYLYGRKFILFCDQQSLSHALELKDCGRVTRWALALQNYDYEIKHTPGKDNIPADVLSRAVNVANTSNQLTSINNISQTRLIELQHLDSKCKEIIQLLDTQHNINIGKNTYFYKDNILHCHQNSKSKFNIKDKLVVPKALITEILKLAHDSPTSAHPGFMKTLNKIRKQFFWHNMRKHVLNYIKSCFSCMERRGYRKGDKAPLQRMPIPSRPFENIAIDAVGPLTMTEEGNKHILVISDYFSRWVEAYAVKDLKTETVAGILEAFISTHGVPKHLISDRGSSFVSEAIKKVYDKFGIIKNSTTSYHPASDGLVERANKTLINALKHLVSHADYQWDKYLNLALLAYRSSFHSAIQDTPAHVVYGRDLILPLDILTTDTKFSYSDTREYCEDLVIRLKDAFQIVRQNLEKAAEKQENYRSRSAKDKNIQVGDLVLLFTPVFKPGQAKKLQSTSKGPYRVKFKSSPVNFKICHINNPKDEQLVHVDRLTRLEDRIIFPALFEFENNKSNSENINDNSNSPQNNNSNFDKPIDNIPKDLPPRLKALFNLNSQTKLDPTCSNSKLNPTFGDSPSNDSLESDGNDPNHEIESENVKIDIIPKGQENDCNYVVHRNNTHGYNLRNVPQRNYKC